MSSDRLAQNQAQALPSVSGEEQSAARSFYIVGAVPLELFAVPNQAFCRAISEFLRKFNESLALMGARTTTPSAVR